MSTQHESHPSSHSQHRIIVFNFFSDNTLYFANYELDLSAIFHPGIRRFHPGTGPGRPGCCYVTDLKTLFQPVYIITFRGPAPSSEYMFIRRTRVFCVGLLELSLTWNSWESLHFNIKQIPKNKDILEKLKIWVKTRQVYETNISTLLQSHHITVSYTRLVLTHILSFSNMPLFFGICFIIYFFKLSASLGFFFFYILTLIQFLKLPQNLQLERMYLISGKTLNVVIMDLQSTFWLKGGFSEFYKFLQIRTYFISQAEVVLTYLGFN